MDEDEHKKQMEAQDTTPEAKAQADLEADEKRAPSVKEPLIEKLSLLKVLRGLKETLNEEYDQKYEKFKEENANLMAALAENREKTGTVESELRVLGVARYAETGEKKLEGGMGIRIMTKLEYDAKTALSWAEEHGIALALDKRAFESYAKLQIKSHLPSDLDFVEAIEEPIATIPKEIKMEEK